MNTNIEKYLKELISIPSPTGYTRDVISFIEEKARNLGYETRTSPKGNLIVQIPGNTSQAKRLVTSHIDTLGAMVKSIKSDGRLKLEKLGGYDWKSIEGENCTIHTQDGKTYTGTILVHQSSVHVYKDASSVERSQDNMEVRLDELVSSKEDVEDLNIQVGDFISFDPRYVLTDSGYIKSRFLDNKTGAAVMLGLMEELKNSKETLAVSCEFHFSTMEEVGMGASSSIGEEIVEYLAIDMGAMGDDQATSEHACSICVKDSSGPYNYDLRLRLVDLCKENDIDYKLDIYPYYGSDASAAMKAGLDAKHGLIGPGVESSHSYERTHLDGLSNTYKLLQAYLTSDLI